MFVYQWNIPVERKTWIPQERVRIIPGNMLMMWQEGMKSHA